MARFIIMMMAIVAVFGLAANAETVWWTYEYDGTDPSATNWGGGSGTVETEGDTTYLHITGATRYDGYTNSTDWNMTGSYTVEFRYRYYGTADGGEDTVNTTESKAQQGMIICDASGRNFSEIYETATSNDTIRFGGTASEGSNVWVDSGSEWNILRIVFDTTNSSRADAYILAGGAMDGNGGAWDSESINAVITNWSGYNNSETLIELNGKMDIDYVRWASGTFDPVAVPEPMTLSLIALGGVFALRRRK